MIHILHRSDQESSFGKYRRAGDQLEKVTAAISWCLTFDSMAELTPLTKDSFKGDLYEVAGSLPVPQTASQSNSSTSAGGDGDDRNE